MYYGKAILTENFSYFCSINVLNFSHKLTLKTVDIMEIGKNEGSFGIFSLDNRNLFAKTFLYRPFFIFIMNDFSNKDTFF